MKEKLFSAISDWAARNDANRAIRHHERAIARLKLAIGVFRHKIDPEFYEIATYEELADEHERAIGAINREFGIGIPDRLRSKTA